MRVEDLTKFEGECPNIAEFLSRLVTVKHKQYE